MTFRSTGIRHGEDGFDVDGELTLHGVTRPVTLALDVNGFTRDPYGGTQAGFSATTEAQPGRLRHQHQPPHGRRRGGHRRPHPGLPRDRSRPQPTPPANP
jgi:YceI-like domain